MFKKPYEPRERLQVKFPNPSRTKQAFKQEANINTILDKYHRTGLMPTYDQPQQYGDYSGVMDYHTAMTKIAEGKSAFADLPSKIRKRFDNNVGAFLDFIHDESNLDEMVELGLARARPKPEPEAPVSEPEPASAGD
jgi:Chlamydia-phage Chp2 scaffold (Chlamy_scaf).